MSCPLQASISQPRAGIMYANWFLSPVSSIQFLALYFLCVLGMYPCKCRSALGISLASHCEFSFALGTQNFQWAEITYPQFPGDTSYLSLYKPGFSALPSGPFISYVDCALFAFLEPCIFRASKVLWMEWQTRTSGDPVGHSYWHESSLDDFEPVTNSHHLGHLSELLWENDSLRKMSESRVGSRMGRKGDRNNCILWSP